jgi:predicted nucleotidyltransferase
VIPGLAEDVAARLIDVDGVRAVVLGGSYARGAADASSDIDLALYYDPKEPLDLEALRRLAAELDDSGSGDAVTATGAWGQWINGGAWLTIGGQRVDWLYRNLPRVHDYISACIAGSPVAHYQPGHPHAFHTHIYLAEAALCIPLEDPYGEVDALKRRALPYPPALKQAVIQGGLWEAGFSLSVCEKSAVRGDALHVHGCLFRAAACLIQALYGLNEAYFINEKGSAAAVDRFAARPDGFAARVGDALGSADLPGAQRAMLGLLDETRALCESAGFVSL